MASSAKRKTTMAKLNRESKLRERRLSKQAKREARKRAPAGGLDPSDGDSAPNEAPNPDAAEPGVGPAALDPSVQLDADAE